jgi:hypothetical protein
MAGRRIQQVFEKMLEWTLPGRCEYGKASEYSSSLVNRNTRPLLHIIQISATLFVMHEPVFNVCLARNGNSTAARIQLSLSSI